VRRQFIEELEAVRESLIEMGESAIALCTDANQAVAGANGNTMEHASELEARIDRQHRLIHDQCLRLITLQAPVARDARLVTGILDAIVDLELIGDYANEIVSISNSITGHPPSQVIGQLTDTGVKVRDLLSAAIDAWRDEGFGPQAAAVRTQAAAVHAECQIVYQKLSKLVPGPGDATPYVNLLLVCKYWERILRHASCVADQAAEAAGTSAGE